jgi:hypothetical protein
MYKILLNCSQNTGVGIPDIIETKEGMPPSLVMIWLGIAEATLDTSEIHIQFSMGSSRYA